MNDFGKETESFGELGELGDLYDPTPVGTCLLHVDIAIIEQVGQVQQIR